MKELAQSSSRNFGDAVDDFDNYDWSGVKAGGMADSTNEPAHAVSPPESSDVSRTQILRQESDATLDKVKDTRKKDRLTTLREETALETLFRLGNHFAPIIEERADTLLYLGTPPQSQSQDDYDYDFVRNQFQSPYLMRSSTLKALGSSKFDKFLGPMSARTERRLTKLGIHKLVQRPESIRYFIDLSPILNDEEALIQITELTVPGGALSWHRTAKSFDVPPEQVCGRDDLDIPPKPTYSLQRSSEPEQEESKEETKAIANQETSMAKVQRPLRSEEHAKEIYYNKPDEEEYTSLRHHTAIARLLHAIAGNNPKLNSAPKAWTFCMLANYFDCAQVPQINDWIVSWLVQGGNMNFIQMQPDIAYRMAMAMQSEWLMRCTFPVLVGQQAMLDGVHETQNASEPKSRKATHVANCLDDDDVNRIDHAAAALARRMRNVLHEIAVSPGIWTFSSCHAPEMAKLEKVDFEDAEGGMMLQAVQHNFKNYVRRMIYMTMSENYGFDTKSVPGFPAFKQFENYIEIPRCLRPLTQRFWAILRIEEYTRDYLNTPSNHAIWARTLDELERTGVVTGEDDIPYVSKKAFIDSIDKLNIRLTANHISRTSQPPRTPTKPSFYHTESARRPETPDIVSPTKRLKLSPDTGSGHIHEQQNEATGQAGKSAIEDAMEDEVETTALRKLIDYDSDSESSEESGQPAKLRVTNASTHADGIFTSDDEWEHALDDNATSNVDQTHTLPIRPKSNGEYLVDEPITRNTASTIPVGPADKFRGSPFEIVFGPSRGYHEFPEAATQVAPPPASLPFRSLSNDQKDHVRDQYATTSSTSAFDPDVNQKIVSNEFFGAGTASGRQYLANRLDAVHRGKDTAWVSRNFPATTSKFTEHLDAGVDNQAKRGRYYPATGSTSYIDAPPHDTPARSSNYIDAPPHNLPIAHMAAPKSIFPSYTINATLLLQEIASHLFRRLEPLVTPGYITDRTCDFDIPVDRIATLLCLSEEEYKYLPLWAGGLDDGSGGVFSDGMEVPDAPDVDDGGFTGGARGLGMGIGSSAGGSVVDSDFSDISTERGISTVGKASRYATDGTATETVISLDE